MLPLVLIGLIVVFIVGLVLAWVGMRGRKINDHPVCRQCAFDLAGVYPEGVTCPECGAGLKREGSVRVGARRRMVGVTLLGLVMALAPLPPVGVVAFAALTGADVNAYKPLGLILWEAKRSDKARTAKLATEVMNRALSKSLSAGQYQTVIDAVLAMQADPRVVWDEGWGDLIERAKLDGVLSAAQESTFNRQAGLLTMRTRTRVHAGQTLPVRVDVGQTRVASSTSAMWGVSFVGATLDGKPLTRAAEKSEPETGGIFGGQAVIRMGGFGDGDGSYLGSVSLLGSRVPGFAGFGGPLSELKLELPEGMPAGKRRLEIDLDVDAQSGGRGAITMAFVNGRLQRGGAAGDTHRVRLTAEIEVVSDGEPVTTAIAPTEEATAALVKAMGPVTVRIAAGEVEFPSGVITQGRARPERVTVELGMKDLPTPAAFDVLVRAHGKEWRLGRVDSGEKPLQNGNTMFTSSFTMTINGITTGSRADGGPGRVSVSAEVGGLAVGDEVEVVLRPSAAAAAATLDLDSYYGGEIVIPGLRVGLDAVSDPFERVRELEERMRKQLMPQRAPRPRGGSGPL